jgi:hypothetical protein
MKRVLLFFLPLSFFISVYGQSDSAYQSLIAQAGLFHLQKDHKQAIAYFEQAFQLQGPDALNAYKAAGVYALDSNADKAFYYLGLALKAGWTEADWLSFDPYFDYLRRVLPDKWKAIELQALTTEQQYEQTLKRPALRRQINMMTLNDQRLRYQRVQATDQNERRGIDQQIMQADQENLDKAKAILQHNGWPSIADIGKDGQNNLWLVVQHADGDVLFQQEALAAMTRLKQAGALNLENYAFLYDRVQCNLNYKQLYGTQVLWTGNGRASGFRPIVQEHLVDQRRRKMGLLPLQLYALTYGFTYHPVSAVQSKQNDVADTRLARRLMDSAGYFYKVQDFQQVYDHYNNASMVPGGMNNNDNYQAAILFATIATLNNEQQYKDIALDFLNLLYLRQALSKKKLLEQPAFKSLAAESRWNTMLQGLEPARH